jgi:hypothetical protein
MSVKPVKVIEPRVNVVGDEDQTHMILFGGNRVTEQIFTADSSQIAPSNPINALFTINPPSTLTIVDRNIRVRAFVEVKTDQPHQLGLNDALRQYPLNSIIDVTAVSINGENVSENSGDKLHAMKCYNEGLEDQGRCVSTTPTYPDQYQEYADYIANGTAKNALGGFGENATMQGARGGFVVDVVDATTFRAVLTEYLQVAPFTNGIGQEHEGMVNVNQLNINLRFKSELTKILSHASSGNAITTVSCQFYERPQCLVRFITPNMTQAIPDVQHLPYHSDQDYIKSAGVVAPGASGQVVSDTIKLGQIPESVTMFIRHSRASSNYAVADSFLKIDSISILFNNESGLFSTATTEDLYEISSKNGCNLSYPAWSNFRGSVLRLRFGVDIGLPDYLAPGTQSQSSIQITVRYTNTGTQPFDGELYTVYRNIGTFSVFENGARASVGNFTPDIVREALNAPEMHHEDYRRIMGGSFWSSLKGFANKVAHLVQKVAPTAGKVASVIAPEAMPIIAGIGRGADVVAKATGGRLAGGRIRRRLR